VLRKAVDPLGSSGVEPAARPWWEPPRKPILSEPPRRRGGGAADVIADLEQRLAEERHALGAERARSEQLEAKLGDVLKVLRSWPEGPMPLAIQNLLAEPVVKTLSSDACHDGDVVAHSDNEEDTGGTKQIRATSAGGTMALRDGSASGHVLPGVELVIYDLELGGAALHVVQGLRRGDAVQWFVEEAMDRAVDVKAVLRSRRKLHAARCLRDTERITRRRDFFEVTDDFGEDQLPLSLEIHLSNSSWFSERRVRLKLCRVERRAFRGSASPWPALVPLEEDE